jgi:SAM-dependent methyltransferase
MNHTSDAPFPASDFSSLAAAEAGNWWFRARNRLILWVLRTRVGGVRRFLEVGCGTGFVLQAVRGAFPRAELTASEYFEEGLVHARARVPDARFLQLDARAMEEAGVWDVIGAFDVIEHIAEDELVLANLARALVPGGWLLVTVPQHRWLWSAVDERACHQRRYTRRELLDKVRATGLQVEYCTSFVSLLVPLMWWSRRQRRDAAAPAQSEFGIPGWLNRALGLVMEVEFGLLRLGLRLPVGGSLLLLARK